MKKHNVMEQMGEIGLTFFFVSSDRKQCKMVRSRQKMLKCHKTWLKVIPQMPEGTNFFCIVSRTKDALTAKSKATFETLDVLAVFENMEEAQDANRVYWTKSQYLEDEQKKEWTLFFAEQLEQLDPANYSKAAFENLKALLTQAPKGEAQ